MITRSLTVFLCLTVATLAVAPVSASDTHAVPMLTLQKFTEKASAVKIDGRLDEPVWSELPVYSDLHVIEPDTLADTEYQTRARLFYTKRGLYVAFDAEQPPETLVARLTSRDKRVSRDLVGIGIDPSGEGLYGYWFDVNLGGSLSDGTILPERQFSSEWDGPWHGASIETESGYTAELFLPWSMMTMPVVSGEMRTMGLNIIRSVAHRRELWSWPALPRSRNQYMSALQKFQIENFTPREQFTFYPYASATYDNINSEDDYKAGFDIFWRPSSNLQLTATANPDFGNVESDDVVVNLTSFETFFPEKRPFFLEGQGIFNTTPRSRPRGFRGTPTMLVNTRRIGSPPRPLVVDDLELTDIEENQPTELRGAAKVTGQKGKWRYGVLAAMENDTKIEGTIHDVEVDLEQAGRDFGVARFLYESTDGGSRKGIGWISTIVAHPDADAIVHGIDGHYLSDGGRWKFDGQLMASDVDDVTGTGGFFDLEYNPTQGIKHRLSFDYFDDELDINDFGFLRRNDAISARYNFRKVNSDLPNLKFRETSLSLSQEYNTDGLVVRSGIFFNQERMFKNNSFLYTEVNYFPSRWDDINSEGNGSYRIEPRRQIGAFWATDSAKPLQIGLGYFYREEDIGGAEHFWETELNWRPSDRFSLSFWNAYRVRSDWLIHWSGRDFGTFESIFWQPRISVDYFLTAKQQLRLSAQWVGIKADEVGRWQVPLGDGRLQPDANPADGGRDFTISTLVFQARYRWEIAPLSDLFVVYTRGSDIPSSPDDDFTQLLRDSWTNRAADVFVIKLRYRLGS